MLSKKSGFTLAEVLIVIAIIGVVSSITINTLIKNYQRKVLETQFKKNYAEISKLSNEFLIEFGNCNNENFNAMNELLKTKLKNAKYENRKYTYIWKNYPKTLNPGQMLENCLFSNTNNYSLASQALIGFCINSNGYMSFTIDINGYDKKPNALGHDLFFFVLDNKTCKFTAPPTGGVNRCSRAYKDNVYTGVDCANYAIQNRCPDDSSKTYWECLP